MMQDHHSYSSQRSSSRDSGSNLPTPSTSPLPEVAPHLLRILVVDDNAVNLAVLAKLLRKNFSQLLDGPPVAVDSGLKALQLLQHNIYDLILMDIQMPFLSGVDCTRRIRQGIDGVLEANRHTTIVAVTTAVGSEPEALYRRSAFDGLIGKPVKTSAMRELLEPLLAAAQEAATTVNSISIKGQMVTPPLPVVPIAGNRCFFLPSIADANSGTDAAPLITKTSDFEALLKEQTRISLFRYGASAIARINSSPGVSDRRRIRDYDDESSSSPSRSSGDEGTGRSPLKEHDGEAPMVMEPSKLRYSTSTSSNHKWTRSGRTSSLTISQSSLNQQIHREMQAAHVHIPTRRTRHLPHLLRLSAPAIITQSSLTDADPVHPCGAGESDALCNEREEDMAADEPLSPYSHFGNSGADDSQQSSLLRVSPSLSSTFGSRWLGRSTFGSERRSTHLGVTAALPDPESPLSAPSSSRSGSMTTEKDGDEGNVTPLTTPENDLGHFLLPSIEEVKAKSTMSLDSLPHPIKSMTEMSHKEDFANSGKSATLPRTKRSSWRPPLERQVATRDVFTIATALHEKFKDFRI